jgi:alkylation response protein AidB-like acyl-CoA dehydrogenase
VFFELTEEQRTLQQVARSSFADLQPLARIRDRWPEPAVDGGAWRSIASTGLTAIGVPEADGGSGGDEIDTVLVCEEAGYAALPEPLVDTVGVAVPVLRDHADGPQRDRWLPPLLAGDGIVTVAVDGTGRVREPASAQAVLLTAGPRVHVVPIEDLQLRRRVTLDPSRPVAEVVHARDLDPATGLRGADVDHVRARAATARSAALVGLSQRMLDDTVAYAGSRAQFGVPIGSFQAVQHQLADVLLAVEQARVAVWYAALRLRDGEADAVRAASVAKVAANAASQDADRAALQIHGGIGFTWEHDLHLLCKRAAAWRAADGDARGHRAVIATHLLGPSETTRTETV